MSAVDCEASRDAGVSCSCCRNDDDEVDVDNDEDNDDDDVDEDNGNELGMPTYSIHAQWHFTTHCTLSVVR